MRKPGLLLILGLLALLLCGCGTASSAAEEPTPPPAAETPAPSPEPTPAPASTPAPTEWVVTDESAEEILALAELRELKRVDGTASTEYAALLRLSELRPDCAVRWELPFQGGRIPSDTVSLTVTDMTGLEELLPLLPALEEVDLLEAGASLEDLDRFWEIRPDVFFLARFSFHTRMIRTDITVYSSLQRVNFSRRSLEYYEPILKHCKKLRALDLGHNDIDDLTLIGELRDLEVLILADNTFTDASPLGNLTELTYLELFLNEEIEDFGFLRKLTKLQNLNCCYCKNLRDLDFLSYMPDFAFGMFKETGVSEEIVEAWSEWLPGVKLVWHDGSTESTSGAWRHGVRYNYIHTAFLYWTHVVRYGSYDDVDFEFDGRIRHISLYKKRT